MLPRGSMLFRAPWRPRGVRDRDGHGRGRAGPGRGGEELLEDAGAPDDLRHAASTRRSCARSAQQNLAEALATQAADPERVRHATCAGTATTAAPATSGSDDWGASGYGIVAARAVHGAQRRDAVGPRVGDASRARASGPGIVITNGSVQADEQMYWYAAQALAKAGYVVLTFDPQGQGQSDTLGEAPDEQRGRPGPDRRAPVLRRHRGRAELLLVERRSTPTSRCASCDRHEPRGQAGTTRRGRARRGLQPVLAAARPARGSASPATPTAPPASPTSASGTRA